MHRKGLSVTRRSVADAATSELVGFAYEILQELERRSADQAVRPDLAPPAVGKSPVLARACIKCKAPVILAKTEKNDEWVVLDEQAGEYDLVAGKARWVGSDGRYTFHFNKCGEDGTEVPARAPDAFEALREDLGLAAP